MKVKLSEIRDSLLGWCMIHGAILKNKDVAKVWPKFDPDDVDITFTVNGVELDLIQTFEDLKKQDERRIKGAAVEYADKKLSKIWELLEAIQYKVRDELGVTIEGD